MSKFSKKLISPIVPPANTAGVYSAVEQLQNLNALAITAVNFCADSSGTDGGLGDDTAVNTAGGFVKLTGSGFTSASIVYINGISVTKYYLSATTIVATVPAATSGTTASLIVFNGSTVGSIWAAGISYSGFPSWTTTAASNLGLVVSTQLVAVGDAPLTYTFISGTLPPNCTISSSGLLSGTVTGVSTNAIYTFTVAVTDAQNQNVSQSIVYTLVVSDFYYRYTSLHISGDSNPTWITDASTNALAVTTTGSPQATTFSPLEAGYYGNSFNGSSDWLSVPTSSTGLALGSGDFTIEAWVYKNASGNGTIFGKTAAINYAIDCYISNNSNYPMMTLSSNGTATTVITGGTVIASNRWYHAAYVRSGTTINIYINGVLDGTGAFSGAVFNAGDITVSGIGARPAGGAPDSWLNGYISNLRIVKGTAVYTANFTPSATPLTAITNTSLLTCQSNRFIDNSAAPATITVAGTPKVVSSNPFNLPSGLAAYGAGYFNGTTDYATIPSSAGLTMGTSNFTVEFWFYTNSTSLSVPLDLRNGSNLNNPSLQWSANSQTSKISAYLDDNFRITSSTMSLSTWYHIALVRSGTVATLYINGVSQGAYVYSTSLASAPVIIGNYFAGGYSFNGYLSNVRIVNGTAVYTSNFTPSTTPLTAITNTVLLTLQTNVPHNNSQFRDTSTNNALITRYGNTTQGSFSPFTKQYPYSTATVGGSAYFDGTGDYLAFPNDPAFSFASSNFTIECWINVTSTSNYHIYVNSDSANNLGVTLYVGSGTVYTYVTAPAGNIVYGMTGPASSVVSGVWTHVAFVRNGSTFTNYVNGVAGTSVTSASAMPDSQVRCYIGTTYNASTSFSGYISNYRVVKGTAVYTSNFTPSITPLTAIPGTVLLMPFTNAAVYDNTMLNNFETVGDMQVNTSTFKYGTGALKFDGTGDYITVSGGASSLHSIQSGAFTVEMWIYRVGNSSGSGTYDALIGSNNVGFAVWGVYVNKNTLAVSFYSSVGLVETTATISNSVWTHIAVSRTTGNNLQIFINGVSGYSASNTGIGTLVNPLYIGADVNNNTFNGYIDELRITKGYARYTAAFTPSSGAYSASAPFGTSTMPSKSLRFRASASAYLSKTFGTPSNNIKWTWSGWVKRGKLSGEQRLFGVGTDLSGINQGSFFFDSNNTLVFNQCDGAGAFQARLVTNALFRDPAAWYHLMIVFDSANATASNRIIMYVNGLTVSYSTATYPSASLASNINANSIAHAIAVAPNDPIQFFDGEMAEVNFVDGLALAPTMFGAYSTYGQWLPISYAGYQGANGFYLPFNAATTTAAANYLVVAGGGGGGVYGGGGAGAGGLRTATGVNLDPTTVYAVTVGAGGAGATAYTAQGISGGNSTFNALTSAGGGGGGSDNDTSINAGLAGGSGGGAALSHNLTWAGGAASPVTSPVQGYAGAGTTASGGSFYNASGGGGGAGGAGTTGSTVAAGGGYGNAGYGTSGNGGAGVVSSISGTSVTYAGGGGGGGASTGAAYPTSYYVTAGAGGAGGGGAGTMVNSRGIAGTTNLGGGGGGGGMYAGGITGGGAGGSGVVIISYSGTQKFYGGNVTSVGGNTIHTFTTSGSLTGIFGDQSGNNNNWTPNNINVSTVGPTYDLLTDVPTLTSVTAANYAVLNPLSASASPKPSDGNLTIAFGGTYPANVLGSIGVSTGKWYWEVGFAGGTFSNGHACGIAVGGWANKNTDPDSTATPYSHYVDSRGYFVNNSTQTSTSINFGAGDIISIALNCDTNVSSFYKNNTLIGSAQSIESGQVWFPFQKNSSYTSLTQYVNFGQRPFTYTPPANFLALNTYNI